MKIKTVAVHDGIFHADEVFAVAVLRFVFGKFSILRTRDVEVLNGADFRVDVGMKHNVKTGDYDHHQDSKDLFRDNGIKYAAFGLIWKEFGAEYCKKLIGHDYVSGLIEVVDETFVQSIDAGDNGQLKYLGDDVLIAYPMKKYVKNLNPTWQETEVDSDKMFEKSVEFALGVLERHVVNESARLYAMDKVRVQVKKNKNEGYLILDEYMPWKEVLVNETDLLYVLFLSSNKKQWRVVAVPTSVGGFENRKSLPLSWKGLTSEELQKVTGVKDAQFCHINRFIAAAESLEGAVKLVELALNEENKNDK